MATRFLLDTNISWDHPGIAGIRRTAYRQQRFVDRRVRQSSRLFCSFLALVLRKELDRCLERTGEGFELSEIKQDLKALQSVTICESGKRFAVSSQSQGVCGKVFQAVGDALPPTIREL